ncbi:uncharacterized protein LOC129287408 isoform X1 [Prosopis cineraria]|uniref:uncharacterized protein LOC129287408 isoform X1 n=1 Tax=Prosopis cineraria TaxID=364024 RepID=UPI00240FF292|nr:uncharacterized protein LOC129287408 isoform X1 [Prosopis cineraria]
MGNSLSSPMGLRMEDPTVKAQLFMWSSKEFKNEYALIYTSRSNPSLTCFSCIARDYNKVRFILHDCLCVGNNVRVGIEFERKRENNGFLAFGPTKIEVSTGSFIVQRQEPGNYFWQYQDQFRHRLDQLWLCRIPNGAWDIHFKTRCDGMNSVLTYFIRILWSPLKGLDVNLSFPHFEYVDSRFKRPFALCHFDLVSGMPPHDVLKQVNVVPSGTSNKIGKQANVKQSELKEEKQGNNDGSSPTSTQNNTIVNSGTSLGKKIYERAKR